MTETHQDWGELYPYSDHKRGDFITYCVDGRTQHGEILWVAVASTLPSSGRDFPPHYVVIADQGSWPDLVLFGEVIQS